MANTYKVLGQNTVNNSTSPGPTFTTLYTVPASTSTVTSVITAYNSGANSGSFNVAVRINGATYATSQTIINQTLAAGFAVQIPLGMTLSAGDVITLVGNYSPSSTTIAVNLFGTEIV